jgi:hypothetical protein
MRHTWCVTYHPMNQGKIEGNQRFMKNVVKLVHCYMPGGLETAIGGRVVHHFDHARYHEQSEHLVHVLMTACSWSEKPGNGSLKI